MGVRDCALYVDGSRVKGMTGFRAFMQSSQDGFIWMGLEYAGASQIDAFLVEARARSRSEIDTSSTPTRSQEERNALIVLQPATIDTDQRLIVGEIRIAIGKRFIVTAGRLDSLDPEIVRCALESEPRGAICNPAGVLLVMVAKTAHGYGEVLEKLESVIFQIEGQLGESSASPNLARQSYRLIVETARLQRALDSFSSTIHDMLVGGLQWGLSENATSELKDIREECVRLISRTRAVRSPLENAFTLHATLVAQEQNEAMRRLAAASLAQGEDMRRLARETHRQGEEMKRISAWGAIFFAPALIAGIYGMNFDVMPELHLAWGYPAALVGMLVVSVTLYLIFRYKRWI